ncbi:MAG: class IV adenylate cyclase [Anaerolineae bacterium]|jgi:adenylate cyclase class 2|nr:class IV adenylate cyclase [Anaerolineae bacterium]
MGRGQNTETEIKLWVDDLDAVAERVLALGGEMTDERVFERNMRYDTAKETLTQRGAVLRLRQDSRARLTYKEGAQAVEGVVSRFEAEVEVSDFDTTDMILRLLGYQHKMVYEKYRTTYVLDGCEIVLDELPFGRFIEIEGEHKAILGLVARLGLADAVRVKMSYVHAFEVIRRRMGLGFEDATFEQFAEVDLPSDVVDWLSEGLG